MRNVVWAAVGIAAVFFTAAGRAHASLLTAGYESQLETWLGEGNLDFTNIYTKTSGDTSQTFHTAADGKGRTFSLIEVVG